MLNRIYLRIGLWCFSKLFPFVTAHLTNPELGGDSDVDALHFGDSEAAVVASMKNFLEHSLKGRNEP